MPIQTLGTILADWEKVACLLAVKKELSHELKE